MNTPPIVKKEFSEKDFEQMSWHDCKIHAIAFDDKNNKLLLDIDYILQWISKGKYFKFWIAPATLIFENVYNLNINIEDSLAQIIDVISRENPHNTINLKDVTEWDWEIQLVSGEINFNSIGYTLSLRKEPIYTGNEEMTLKERGGISFGDYEGI